MPNRFERFLDVSDKKTYPVFRRIVTPERYFEYVATQIMIASETLHDINLVPQQYGYSRDRVGPIFEPNDPIIRWAYDHIGDIFEISYGFGGMRLLLIGANEILRKKTGKEIPDNVQFWASLVPWTIIKAIHSLGYISLFGIHDHMDKPVPGMLFGQAVAAAALIGAHYGIKNRKQIYDFARNSTALAGNLATKAAKFTQTQLKGKGDALKKTVNTSIQKSKDMTKRTIERGKKNVFEPAKETYTKLKLRLTDEWNNTPLEIRTSFKNAGGALLLESLSYYFGGQNLEYLTLFLGLIGLINGLSYKINPAVTKPNTKDVK